MKRSLTEITGNFGRGKFPHVRWFTGPACRRAALAAAALGLGGFLIPAAAGAEAPWPTRPIKLIVPYAAGAGSDIIGRTIASKLSERLGQPVIVDNRTGAGGTVGVDAVAKAPADGYTLLFTTTAFATNASSGRKLPYNPATAFTPIGEIASTPLLIVVAGQSPIKTLRELVDKARAKPNTVTYASSGISSMSHLGMEMLDAVAKVQMTHVPYKGLAPAFTDLLAGRVDTALCTFASASALLEAGKLRGLVVTSEQRSPFVSNLPSSTEAGFPDFRIDFWWGILAPAKVPPAVVKRLNEELNAILVTPDMRDLLAREAAVPTPGRPESFGKLVSFEIARWGKLIKDANIQPE